MVYFNINSFSNYPNLNYTLCDTIIENFTDKPSSKEESLNDFLIENPLDVSIETPEELIIPEEEVKNIVMEEVEIKKITSKPDVKGGFTFSGFNKLKEMAEKKLKDKMEKEKEKLKKKLEDEKQAAQKKLEEEKAKAQKAIEDKKKEMKEKAQKELDKKKEELEKKKEEAQGKIKEKADAIKKKNEALEKKQKEEQKKLQNTVDQQKKDIKKMMSFMN